jgi:hypothetical protein
MDLGPIEQSLVAALREALGRDFELSRGPVVPGPASGVRPQVFVHAAAFDDGGGRTDDGAQVAALPLERPDGVRGVAEQRPATIDVEIGCLCGQHVQAQTLAGLVVPAAMAALATLGPVRLSDPADGRRRLHFAEHRCAVHRLRSWRLPETGAPASVVLLTLRLAGFVHVQLTAPGGLAPRDPYAANIELQIVADPAGPDVAREHLLVRNAGAAPLELAGWTLSDAARRPHVYRFDAPRTLAPGDTLRLWTGRGRDDASQVYWGRRKAVWNNTGDIALLRDPDGAERARATWRPPLPEAPDPPAGKGKASTTTRTPRRR